MIRSPDFVLARPQWPNSMLGVDVPKSVVTWLLSLRDSSPLGQQPLRGLDFRVDLVCGLLKELIPRLLEPKRLQMYFEQFNKSVERQRQVQSLRKDEVERWLAGENLGTPCKFDALELAYIKPFIDKLQKNQPDPVWILAARVDLWLKAYAMTLCQPDNPFAIIARRMYDLIQIGWWPSEWVGTVERGYAVAWCPPDHPRQEVPEANRVTPEYRALALTPVPKRAPLVLPELDVPVVPTATWAALADMPPSQAFVSHFSFLAETDQCRDLLRRISERVESIEVGTKQLTVHFLPTPDDEEDPDDPWEGERMTLKAPAPFAKKLGPLPRSLAELLRRHNGLSFGGSSGGSPTRVPKYDGEHLAIDNWEGYWQPDPFDPDEPFSEPPQVVLWRSSDLVVCHSFLERSPGEPALIPISHETCWMDDPLPYGIGGLIIRTLGSDVLGHHVAVEEGWRIPF